MAAFRNRYPVRAIVAIKGCGVLIRIRELLREHRFAIYVNAQRSAPVARHALHEHPESAVPGRVDLEGERIVQVRVVTQPVLQSRHWPVGLEIAFPRDAYGIWLIPGRRVPRRRLRSDQGVAGNLHRRSVGIQNFSIKWADTLLHEIKPLDPPVKRRVNRVQVLRMHVRVPPPGQRDARLKLPHAAERAIVDMHARRVQVAGPALMIDAKLSMKMWPVRCGALLRNVQPEIPGHVLGFIMMRLHEIKR